MRSNEQFKLAELAELADVTPRTVRYYIAQRLLASPGRLGPGTRYGTDHLTRLRLIKRLQDERLPLAAIRRRLDGLPDEQIMDLAESPIPTGAPLDRPMPRLAAMTRADQEIAPRTQWERITLSPDVELHVRRPLTPSADRSVERLVTLGRRMVGGEE